jgi:DNA-binding XRE family transcriptional regulator
MRAKQQAATDGLKSLQELLIYTRAKSKLTQTEMIRRLGCTPTTFKAWEKGQKPRAEWYVAIGKLCGVPLERVVALVVGVP